MKTLIDPSAISVIKPESPEHTFQIRPYSGADAAMWNDFVAKARNSTFLFNRSYADYHSDRFKDASLIITRGDKIAALFIASGNGDIISAHGGLTYGGLILPLSGTTAPDVVEIMEEIARYYRHGGYRKLIYKHIPQIYCTSGADDPVYALFRLGAQISEVNLSTAINLTDPQAPAPNPKTRRRAAHALRDGLTVSQSADYGSFWAMLTETLRSRHNASPVHSLDEIELLASRFPDNIKLYTVTDPAGNLLAGSVLYISDRVVHAQYTASTPMGRDMGAVHLLYLEIRRLFTGRQGYLDFGISNEDHGLILNSGLIDQKWNYGARPVAHYIFSLDL